MKNKYYIATDSVTKKIIVSKNYLEIFDFIVVAKKIKLCTIDFKVKPRNIDKRVFLTEFHKNVKDNKKLFELGVLLIKGTSNLRFFFGGISLRTEFDFYQKNKNNLL